MTMECKLVEIPLPAALKFHSACSEIYDLIDRYLLYGTDSVITIISPTQHYDLLMRMKVLVRQSHEVVEYAFQTLFKRILQIHHHDPKMFRRAGRPKKDDISTTDAPDDNLKEVKPKDVIKQLDHIFVIFDTMFQRSFRFRQLVAAKIREIMLPFFKGAKETVSEFFTDLQWQQIRDILIGYLQNWNYRFGLLHLELRVLIDYLNYLGYTVLHGDQLQKLKAAELTASTSAVPRKEESEKHKKKRLKQLKLLNKEAKDLLSTEAVMKKRLEKHLKPTEATKKPSKITAVESFFDQISSVVDRLPKLCNFENPEKETSRALKLMKRLINLRYHFGRKLDKFDIVSKPLFQEFSMFSKIDDSDSDDDFEDVPDKTDEIAFILAGARRNVTVPEASPEELFQPDLATTSRKEPVRNRPKRASKVAIASLPTLDEIESSDALRPRKFNKKQSTAREMDLSNSWHRNDDWVDDSLAEEHATVDMVNSYSADGSVAVINIPTLEAPILHQCRAKLTNGKLCARKDRLKCPFHGLIVPRDADGDPISGQTEFLAGMFAKDQPKRRGGGKQRADLRDRIAKDIRRKRGYWI